MYAQINKPKKLINKKTIDISGNKKTQRYLYGAAAAAAIILIAAGCLISPISNLFETRGFIWLLFRFVVVLAILAAYLYAHEYIHTLAANKLCGEKCKVVIKKYYAYASTKAYYTKRGYLIYSFAPVVILGAALLLFMIILPAKYFWFAYLAQVLNIAGAAGDVYAAVILSKEKGGLWIKDGGNSITYWNR